MAPGEIRRAAFSSLGPYSIRRRDASSLLRPRSAVLLNCESTSSIFRWYPLSMSPFSPVHLFQEKTRPEQRSQNTPAHRLIDVADSKGRWRATSSSEEANVPIWTGRHLWETA